MASYDPMQYADPTTQAQMAELLRKQKFYDNMQTPDNYDINPTVGSGQYARVLPTWGKALASGARMAAGAYASGKNQEKQLALAKALQEKQDTAMSDYINAKETPAVVGVEGSAAVPADENALMGPPKADIDGEGNAYDSYGRGNGGQAAVQAVQAQPGVTKEQAQMAAMLKGAQFNPTLAHMAPAFMQKAMERDMATDAMKDYQMPAHAAAPAAPTTLTGNEQGVPQGMTGMVGDPNQAYRDVMSITDPKEREAALAQLQTQMTPTSKQEPMIGGRTAMQLSQMSVDPRLPAATRAVASAQLKQLETQQFTGQQNDLNRGNKLQVVGVQQEGANARTSMQQEGATERANIAAKARADVASAGVTGEPVKQETIDYYAEQSLSGDNSWQTGLARGKVGQQLIASVKDRIPAMAAERNLTPQDALVNKSDRASVTKALTQVQSRTAGIELGSKKIEKDIVTMQNLEKSGNLDLPQFASKPLNWAIAGTGTSPELRGYALAAKQVATEYARMMTGGMLSTAQLHRGAAEDAKKILDENMTIDEVRKIIPVMLQEIQNGKEASHETLTELRTQLGNVGRATPAQNKAAPVAPKANANQEALDWLKANPNHPKAPAVKAKLGI